MPLAALLLVLVAAVHYGPDLLALQYPEPDAARRALYYVARSIEGAAQYALLAWLAVRLSGWKRATEPGRLKGPAATVSPMLVVVVCLCGGVEHVQAAACRLSIGIGNKVPTGRPLSGLCDDLLSLPMYALGLGALAFVAAILAAQFGERNG